LTPQRCRSTASSNASLKSFKGAAKLHCRHRRNARKNVFSNWERRELEFDARQRFAATAALAACLCANGIILGASHIQRFVMGIFTGLIMEVGRVRRVERRTDGAVMVFAARKVLEGTRLGDSI